MEENQTLASEMLHELKATCKRWFIIAVAELIAIIVIIAGFLWYISLPVEEYTTLSQDATQIGSEGSSITQSVGE